MRASRLFAARLAAGLLVATLATHQASAAMVVWTLSNATYSFGPGVVGTATGSFTYDADSSTFSAISIVTTDSIAGANTFTQFALKNSFGENVFFQAPDADPSGGSLDLMLNPVSPFTNAGGTLAISTLPFFAIGQCYDANCEGAGGQTKWLGGSLIGTPEVPLPAAAWLLISGLGGLGLLARRRQGGVAPANG